MSSSLSSTTSTERAALLEQLAQKDRRIATNSETLSQQLSLQAENEEKIIALAQNNLQVMEKQAVIEGEVASLLAKLRQSTPLKSQDEATSSKVYMVVIGLIAGGLLSSGVVWGILRLAR